MKRCLLFLLLTVLFGFSTARAAIIYSTYSSSVNIDGNYVITNGDPSSDMAARFTVPGMGPDYYLDSIELYLQDARISNGTNDFLTLGIAGHHSTNNIPDTSSYVLSPESFTNNIQDSYSLIEFNPVERPVLYAGITYWLIGSVEEAESSLGELVYNWALNRDIVDWSAIASRAYSGSWDDILLNRPLIYQINGTPVPIPGAIWLLGSGLIGLISLRRKYTK